MKTWSNRSTGWVGLLAGLALAGLAQAGPVSGQGTWETTLKARDINGDGQVDAYYDSALNITWLADANAGAGSLFDSTGFTTATDGQMTWYDAMNWVANLSVHGTTGWRLPTIVDTGAPGCDYSDAGGTDCGHNVDVTTSELAHLFYVTLGNLAYCMPGFPNCMIQPVGWGLTNTGPFAHMQTQIYWSGNAFALHPSLGSWYFGPMWGFQGFGPARLQGHAHAVYAGDVAAAAVPEPQSYALMLLGLATILVVGRRSLA